MAHRSHAITPSLSAPVQSTSDTTGAGQESLFFPFAGSWLRLRSGLALLRRLSRRGLFNGGARLRHLDHWLFTVGDRLDLRGERQVLDMNRRIHDVERRDIHLNRLRQVAG